MAHASYDVRRTRPAAVVVALLVGVLVGVLVVLAGCAQPQSSSATGRHRPGVHRTASPAHHTTPKPKPSPKPSHPAASTTTRPPSSAVSVARRQLRGLVVRPRPVGTEGYVRDAFGSDWVDTDGNGCNQRDDVLLRDAVPGTTRVAQQDSCDHDVLAGTWHDPYTGRTLRFTDLKDLSQAESIQIDHIVPLAEAWVSGARRWSRDRRETFANDLGELLAVDGPTNMSKGDGDPAAWRPRKGYQCAYARHWIAVKARYRLAADLSEEAALEQMLAYCR
jgi:Protein of unknown function (DUF1524)